MTPQHPFPSFGYYAELVEGIGDLLLQQIEERYHMSLRYWNDTTMNEQYRHLLQAEQKRASLILAHAVNTLRRVTLNQALQIAGGKQ